MIYVDLDETLNHMLSPWLNWINDEFHTAYTIEDINSWTSVSELEGVGDSCWGFFTYENYMALPVREGAEEFLKRLKEFDDVTIISATCGDTIKAKDDYCELYFGMPVVHENNKWVRMNEGDILIDDGFHNVYPAIKEAKAVGMLFNDKGKLLYADYRMAHKDFHRVRDYEDIIEKLEKIYGQR